MRGDTLIQRHPPTPPTLLGDFHSGLHRVAQYNADRGYPYDESSYGPAGIVGHEGLPSRTSHVAGDGMGLGIHYVGTLIPKIQVTMLIRFKDGYGASEYYPESQGHGRQVRSTIRCAASTANVE
jgi:hypothetical protein